MTQAYLVIDDQKFTPVQNCKIVLVDQPVQSDNIQELLSKARFHIPLDAFGVGLGNGNQIQSSRRSSSSATSSSSMTTSDGGNLRRQPGWENSPNTRHLLATEYQNA